MCEGVHACVSEPLTPVADHAHGRRREDEETLPKQRKLPQHHYLLPEKLDELGHAASGVGDLHKKRLGLSMLLLLFSDRQYKYALLLSDLHFWVHAAVDGGDAPGWTSSDQTVSCRGKDSLLILIEGLQRRVLAWTLQLMPTRERQEEEKDELSQG